MEKIVVIGVGALGRRHLQALLELKDEYELYGVEVNKEALAALRAEFPEVSFFDSVEQLPKKIVFCVISTSSNVRRQVFDELMSHAEVRYLLFEKVLFQKIEDYDHVSDVLKEKGCKAWINCARREMKSYIKIKEEVANEKIYTYTVTGNEWGLCCNGIHMLDLLLYLTGKKDFSAGQSVFANGIRESKRKGFKEIYGTIAGTCEKDTFFQISCMEGGGAPSLVMITSENKNIVIDEGQTIHISKRENGWKWETEEFPIEYISQLTGRIARDIIANGNCRLPLYQQEVEIHKKYIRMWLSEFHRQGMEGEVCPIT